MNVEILPLDKNSAEAFIKLPYFIYKDDTEFIPHIEQDIKDIFNSETNKYLRNGSCERWIAKKGDIVVGRIAAAIKQGEVQGRIGFFECVDDKTIAKQLFSAAEQWLAAQGAKTAEAPVNFGGRDSFWGLMVGGFCRPSYRENYNPVYYQSLIEYAGYSAEFRQITSEITPATFNFERFSKLASRVLGNAEYEFKHLSFDKIDQFAEDFVYIYNKAWEKHEFFEPVNKKDILKEMKSMKPIAQPQFNWFAYANGEPAGFYLNVLDINQVFKKVNGKLNLIGKLKFLLGKHKIDRIRGIVFGVIPNHQNKGLETGMIMKLYEEVVKIKTIKSSELSWIGDFNPKMQSLFNSLGAVTTKEHLTFKKLL